MKTFFLLISLVFALAAGAAELDALLATRAELWKMSGDAVMTNLPDVFQWMDSTKTRMRYNVREGKTPLTLFGNRVLEAIFDFTDGKVSALNVSIYNRGDGGEITKKAFDAALEAVQAKLGAYVGKDVVPQYQNMSAGGARLRSQAWRAETGDATLRWSASRDRPEFITVGFYPPGKAPKSLREGLKTSVGSSELEDRVIEDEDGSRYVMVPMVDQGAKGYCVAATVERILRYYGSNIDQHVVAKLAESDSARGTNINKIVDALEGNQAKLGIRLKQLYRYEELETYSDLKKLCANYNSLARRNKEKKLDLDDYTVTIDKVKFLNYGALMKSLDFGIFRDLRGKDRRASKVFFKEVRDSIDEGIPLCWSTYIFPAVDKSSSEFGMHMRIITGYNAKTGDLIYSDSWGAGHEKKIMKPEDAWGITVNLISLEPRHKNSR